MVKKNEDGHLEITLKLGSSDYSNILRSLIWHISNAPANDNTNSDEKYFLGILIEEFLPTENFIQTQIFDKTQFNKQN